MMMVMMMLLLCAEMGVRACALSACAATIVKYRRATRPIPLFGKAGRRKRRGEVEVGRGGEGRGRGRRKLRPPGREGEGEGAGWVAYQCEDLSGGGVLVGVIVISAVIVIRVVVVVRTCKERQSAM